MKKELEILKLNTYFRIKNGADSPGKRARVLLCQNINFAGTFGGMVVNMIYNLVYSTNAKNTPKAIANLATEPRLVGKSILIADTLLEVLLEERERKREQRNGLDVASTDKHIESLRDEINGLLYKRTSLIDFSKDLSQSDKSIARAESG